VTGGSEHKEWYGGGWPADLEPRRRPAGAAVSSGGKARARGSRSCASATTATGDGRELGSVAVPLRSLPTRRATYRPSS
jgi:hypothetical protein